MLGLCLLLRLGNTFCTLCNSGFVDDVIFTHNGANTHTGHWQTKFTIAVREVCYRLLPCNINMIVAMQWRSQ